MTLGQIHPQVLISVIFSEFLQQTDSGKDQLVSDNNDKNYSSRLMSILDNFIKSE